MTQGIRRVGYAAVSLMALAGLVAAQAPSASAALAPAAYSRMRWRYIGPPGNRTDAVAGVAGNPLIFYAGAASGGVFKTTDGGETWAPMFDAEPVQSIGALAVARSNPNIVWAGTGESFIRSDISIGDGIYKSTDAGVTWRHMGLDQTGRIGRIVINPRDPDVVLACAQGNDYGPQPERGVYRSTDGGKTWAKTLFVDENTGCSDIALDMSNPEIVYASTWQIILHTWGRTSGGPGSGIFKSLDGGATWTRLRGHGLPHSPLGKIGLALAPSDPSRVYALIETGDGVPDNGQPTQIGQLWSSDNAGATWTLVSSDRDLRSRTAYYTRGEVSSGNPNEMYFLGNSFTRTLDGGHTLTRMPSSPGGDNHDMWIDPTNAQSIAVANDSGISLTVDGGRTWRHVRLANGQMYHVTVDDQVPYNLYGNEQDTGSYEGPSRMPTAGGRGGRGGAITAGDWHTIGGGEEGFATPDPKDPNIVWSSGTGEGAVGGVVTRYDERNGQTRNVEVWPESVAGSPASAVKYRFNWQFPLLMSPFDHNQIYTASQVVHVTTNGGQSWQVISPDLTLNDKSRMGISGGLTPDNIGVEYAGVIYALAESPKQQGLLWAGTNDGQVQLTRDGGKTWTNLTKNLPDLPPWGTVDNIFPSPFDAATAYLTVDFHQMDNRDPFVYRTHDYGQTWTKITTGLPHTPVGYAHCVIEDPVRQGLLYLGTEGGMYVSFNDGDQWQPLQLNLPHAPVYWLTVQPRRHDLVAATYGRGFWILDDIAPFEQYSAQAASSDAYLFPPRPEYRFRGGVRIITNGADASAGQNPPPGAFIDFYVSSPDSRATITIRDASGKTVNTLHTRAARGLNRVYWDLRTAPLPTIRLRTLSPYAPDQTLNAQGWRPAPGNRPLSLMAPPGAYTVELTAGGQTLKQPFELLKDPHSDGTLADIAAQDKLANTIAGEVETVTRTINRIELVRGQLAGLEQAVSADPGGPAAGDSAALDKTASALDASLLTVESDLYNTRATGKGEDQWRWAPTLVDKLSYLESEITSSDFAPTDQEVEVNTMLAQQVTSHQQALDHIVATGLAAFNASLRQKNIPNVLAGGKR
ncbi:MAG: WD40/YVTN/BNR-like repeat-containing protein [Terriglobales bacterium]